MSVAHDVFAETNPAFCAYVAYSFTKAYASVRQIGADLPLIYLALPLALSGDLAGSFQGTNRNTGLREWFERNPGLGVGLYERVNSCLQLVTEAVRFGCFLGILELDGEGHVRAVPAVVKKGAVTALDRSSSQGIKHIERLAYWFAGAGSTEVVFEILGLDL